MIRLGISNFYGAVYVIEEDGKFYICLDTESVTDMKEISKEFYQAVKKEFED